MQPTETTPGAAPPVRIKVYGLFALTRRGYVRLLLAGAMFLVIVLVLWLSMKPPRPPVGREPTFSEKFLLFVHGNLPWIVAAAVALEGVEAMFILRRFAREEAAQRARLPGRSTDPKP